MLFDPTRFQKYSGYSGEEKRLGGEREREREREMLKPEERERC